MAWTRMVSRLVVMLASGAAVAVACVDAPEPRVSEQSDAVNVSKVVKVCGRRTSAGNPQSWWVDSGIYVASGTSITVDGSAPGLGIQPWLGGTFWPPAGNPASLDWHDSLGYRSGLTAPAENVSFSLIAKIGRDGTAIRIGTSRVFTATTSGTLYLAFNDGVNFQDNAGSWNVTVTYPQVVSLGSGHDTLTVFADRINTSLVDRWGVVLTVRDNTPGLGWTPTAVDNVVAALTAIEGRLGVPFSQVFGGVELRLGGNTGAGQTVASADTASFIEFGTATTTGTQGRVDNRGFGRNSAPQGLDYYPSPTVYGFNNANDLGIQNTVIHELGHMLEYRTRSTAGRPVAATAQMVNIGGAFGLRRMKMPTNPDQDNPGDIAIFWEAQFDVDQQPEIIADSFLNWVRNSFIDMVGQIDTPPTSGLTADQQNTIRFWNGGTAGTTTSAGWAGTNGFRAAASAYVTATNVAALLRGLGSGNPMAKTGGDPDPMCKF